MSMGKSTLIQAQNVTSDVTYIDFTSGIDSTYDEYMFVLTGITNTGSEVDLQFQVNATDGADYNDSEMTTVIYYANHDETDNTTYTYLQYIADADLQNATTFQKIAKDNSTVTNYPDAVYDGTLHLFNPASTTFVKHWYSHVMPDGGRDFFVAGYINDTTAIDNVRFKMDDDGNFQGSIHMFGIS